MDRTTNIVFVLALLAAFALGLSVNADISTPFNEKTEKLQLVIVQVPARVDPPTEEPVLEPVSRRETNQILRRLPYMPHNPATPGATKRIHCIKTPVRDRRGGDCACWVDGKYCLTAQNEARELSKQERFKQCYDKNKKAVVDHNALRTCDCWVFDEGPPGTLCYMLHKRDECLNIYTPELAEACFNYWVTEEIPVKMGWK
jgi:hypothetical protein